MHRAHRTCLLLALVALPLVAAGCGDGSRLQVQGKLVTNGTPYTHSAGTETLQVTFRSGGPDGQSFTPAVDEATGAFRLLGGEGDGVPPGKYTVEVVSLPYGPPKPGRQGDRFRGRFAGANSPLQVEIRPDTRLITIDVGAGTATAS